MNRRAVSAGQLNSGLIESECITPPHRAAGHHKRENINLPTPWYMIFYMDDHGETLS